jgi:hypothetical protein
MARAGPFGEDGGVVDVLVAHYRIELAHDFVAALYQLIEPGAGGYAIPCPRGS